MKKTLFIISFGLTALFLQSCTKTCVCKDANNHVQEIEVDPSENCGDRSGDILGECS
ncbi:MAG: hypothetical protein FWF70_08320 [Bacteroidetes bacterium]|nr:hypothetical protein [Bacteroidota bacterium]MCL1968257.1 hypothetical protein [Bacteroidota bacterium]